MVRRLREFLQFQVERFLLGGPQFRLLFLMALVGLISVVGGAILHRFDPAAADEPWNHAIWWAFLRLTDPGYLGDDQGVLRRVLATAITVLGYVIFMGALIAVMTQWLNQTIRRLEMGLTPVAMRRHVAILGWTSQTPELVAELTASAGRLRRFLRAAGARRLRVAILGEEIDHSHDVALRERLGPRYRWGGTILRSGSMLQDEHLARVDCWRASTVLIPAELRVTEGSADPDARLIKTLLTIARGAGGEPPLVVASVRDARRVPVIRSAYPAGRVELIAVDAIVGRLLAQTLRQPGLTHLVSELLDQAVGNELYLRSEPDLAGRRVGDLDHFWKDAVFIGLIRREGDEIRSLLHPPADELLRSDDRLVLLAEDFQVKRAVAGPPPAARETALAHTKWAARRILVLGWSQLMPAFLRELSTYGGEARELDIASTVPMGTRRKRLSQAGVDAGGLTIRHHEADIAVPGDLESLPVAEADVVVILGSDRLESDEDADARSLATHHLLRSMPAARKARIVVELRDPANAGFFTDARSEVLCSGVVVSHLLAQIALRRELGAVYDALLGPGGAEFSFIRAADAGLLGATVTFADCVAHARHSGCIALGLRRGDGTLMLNPSRHQTLTLATEDCLVVLREA